MRKVVFISFIACIMTFISACNTDHGVKDAKNLATQFKEEQMQIVNYRKLKKYLTEQAWLNLQQNRTMQLLLQAAKKQQANFIVKKITFNKSTYNKRNNTVDLDYTLDLQRNDSENAQTKVISITGQMTVVKGQDGWKISRDWFEKDSLSKLLQ